MKKHLGNYVELPTSTKPCRPLMAKTNPKWTLAKMGRTMNRALLMRIMVPHTLPRMNKLSQHLEPKISLRRTTFSIRRAEMIYVCTETEQQC